MKRFFVTAAVTSLLATSAMAGAYSKSGPAMAEPVVQTPVAPVAAPRFNWTGAYAGLGLGYGSMRIRGESSSSTAIGGLGLGYRWDTGPAVVGVEGIIAPAVGSSRLPNRDKIRFGGTVLLTAGVPVGDDTRTLVHAGLGPSFLQTSGDDGSRTATGVAVQFGVDHMLTDEIAVRGSVFYNAINGVSNARYKTRTLGAGVGLSFRF